MTPPSIETKSDVQSVVEASAWRTRLTEMDAESSPGFEAWLEADPKNLVAWSEVMSLWAEIGEQATAPEIMAARRDALHRASSHSRRRWSGWRLTVSGGAVAVAVVALVVVGFVFIKLPQDYKTAFGERRVVTLSDGSKMSLDSESEVRVAFSPKHRSLNLLHGQARFDVAHDISRPFTVRARNETVVATGTAFNVDMTKAAVVVTLIQGRVSVIQGAPSNRNLAVGSKLPSAVVLTPGLQFVSYAEAAGAVQAASLDKTTAWESGQLIFDDEPLSEVVERVNRYSTQPIHLKPGVSALRISGVFNSGDTKTFVDTVTHYLPVESVESVDGEVTLGPKKFPEK